MTKKPLIYRKVLDHIKPYVPGKPIEEVERELGLKNVIKMASNENPLGPSPEAVDAIQRSAERVYLYPDGNQYYLKKHIAQHVGVAADNIIVGNGSDEVIKFLAEVFIAEGDQAVMAAPTFSEYDFAVNLMGGESIFVPLDNFRHDLEAMADRITERTRLVFICNPNNPTGTIVTEHEVDSFMAKVPDDVIVVFDEAYYEYVAHPTYPNSLKYLEAGKNNVIILRTFSKIYGLAGLRVGYGIASKELLNLLNRAREPFNVNSLAQVAAMAALHDQLHVEKSQKLNEEGKEYLYSTFKEMGLKYVPTEANFILVDVKVDSKRLFKAMLQHGVIVRTGDIFGLPTFIRVTVGTRRQNQIFIETLQKVLAELG